MSRVAERGHAMHVTLTYNGIIDVKTYKRGDVMALPDGSTPQTVMDLCGIRPPHQPFVIPFVNQAQARLDTPLKEGDHVCLFLPLGGG
jgi:hypothetical protein